MTAAASRFDLGRETAYLRDLGRAFAGALLFNTPLLMTMEMWEQGVAMDRWRALGFLAAGLPLLYGLSRYAGFSKDRGLRNDLLDTAVALAVGFITAATLLALFGVVRGDAPHDAVGMVALQAIPGGMGALLARRQLAGDDGGDTDEGQASYVGELFLMAAGALFFALNIAPTEEVILIAYKAAPWQDLVMLGLSVLLLHLIVFTVGFAGQEEADHPFKAFLHFTLPGYALTLGVSLFALYLFGRADGHPLVTWLEMGVVLSVPGAIGAAAARLLV